MCALRGCCIVKFDFCNTLYHHPAIICARVLTSSLFHPRTSELCLTLSLWSTIVKLWLLNSNMCACFLLIVIILLSSICKSQLHFVSCGVFFSQLNEDYDSLNILSYYTCHHTALLSVQIVIT